MPIPIASHKSSDEWLNSLGENIKNLRILNDLDQKTLAPIWSERAPKASTV